MKSFKSVSKSYSVSAKVCYIGANGMAISDYECESASKSEVKIKKLIRDSFKADGNKVLGISDVVVSEKRDIVTYKFDITTDALIKLLLDSDIAYTVDSADDSEK